MLPLNVSIATKSLIGYITSLYLQAYNSRTTELIGFKFCYGNEVTGSIPSMVLISWKDG